MTQRPIPPGSTSQWPQRAVISRLYPGLKRVETFPDEVRIPFIEKKGLGELAVLRERGQSPVRDLGFSPDDRLYDWSDQYLEPAQASEAIVWLDAQRCIEPDPDDLSALGTAYEVVHVNVPGEQLVVIERIPTTLRVEALDEEGFPVFSYTGLNGEDPCIEELVHPDPAVAPLRWQWQIAIDAISPHSAREIPWNYLGPIPADQAGTQTLIRTWSDLRYGTQSRWADRIQLICLSSMRVRYWVTFFGEENRWRIRVGARLSGYRQIAGRRGAALNAATTRIV